MASRNRLSDELRQRFFGAYENDQFTEGDLDMFVTLMTRGYGRVQLRTLMEGMVSGGIPRSSLDQFLGSPPTIAADDTLTPLQRARLEVSNAEQPHNAILATHIAQVTRNPEDRRFAQELFLACPDDRWFNAGGHMVELLLNLGDNEAAIRLVLSRDASPVCNVVQAWANIAEVTRRESDLALARRAAEGCSGTDGVRAWSYLARSTRLEQDGHACVEALRRMRPLSTSATTKEIRGANGARAQCVIALLRTGQLDLAREVLSTLSSEHLHLLCSIQLEGRVDPQAQINTLWEEARSKLPQYRGRILWDIAEELCRLGRVDLVRTLPGMLMSYGDQVAIWTILWWATREERWLEHATRRLQEERRWKNSGPEAAENFQFPLLGHIRAAAQAKLEGNTHPLLRLTERLSSAHDRGHAYLAIHEGFYGNGVVTRQFHHG